MKTLHRMPPRAWEWIVSLLILIAVALGACSHLLTMRGGVVKRPAATEFGLGPRASEKQVYNATLQPRQPLRQRQLLSVPVRITDADGRPVEGAAIAVDGGMPEHGHGLPTQPRVRRALGGGLYEIEGLRFNMGGWWELKLSIESGAGSDRVTFNLDLARDAALGEALALALETLEAQPRDPGNRYADDPAAADLGHRLFFDARLSAAGRVACATCHDPRKDFQDGVALARGVGTTDRRTMPIAATAHSPFLFWDGRKDSQWAQALGPLESAVEHGGSRAQYAHLIATHYRPDYERVFGPLPDLRGVPAAAGPVADATARAAWDAMTQKQRDAVTEVFVNVGKAIAAYERHIQYAPSRFDRFVAAWKQEGKRPKHLLSKDEMAGMALFMGKANCTQCHNGPLLTNNEFHNTGVPARAALPADRGRITAVAAVKSDEFNCRSRWSDAPPDQCSELEFLPPAEHALERAYKVPSLRNIAERAPYMHAGQFATLAEVLEHYNRAPAAPAGHTELKPLGLSRTELRQLEAFLRTLSGGLAAPAKYLGPPAAAVMSSAE
jgi:cytochrome c peroxidase